MPEVIYISGPITGTPNDNVELFARAALRLRGMGYEVINPHDLHEGATYTDWGGFIRTDIIEICRRATRLALLPGWEQSQGAQVEVNLARGLGIPCQPSTDIRPPRSYTEEQMNKADAMGYHRGVQEERARCAGIMNFVMNTNSGALGYFTPAQCLQMMQDGRTLESVECGKHFDMPYTPEPLSGAGLIAAERLRQIEEEGFGSAHDDKHHDENLARAAACYAAPEFIYDARDTEYWPLDSGCDKRNSSIRHGANSRSPKTAKIRIRELTKAGALCAAEIDRLKRQEKPENADA